MDVIALVAAALGLATLVFLGHWLWERSRRIRLRDTRQESEWDRIDRELDLAEQAGRFRIVGDLGDVAIQSVSRLVTQAEAVRYAADADPAAALRSAGVLETSARTLASTGTFRQLTVMPWIYYRLYARYFDDVRFRFCPWNLPPGGVYVCRGVRPASVAVTK